MSVVTGERTIDPAALVPGALEAGLFRGQAISVLGLARSGIALARFLHDAGAIVSVYDPEASVNAHRVYPDLEYAASLDQALAGAEVTVLLTEWQEFRTADPAQMGEQVRTRTVVDTRNALDADSFRAAGWDYWALGRPHTAPVPVPVV